MKTILVIAGTRPEAIKVAPVIAELRARAMLNVRLCVTAQHRHMLDQVLDIFDLKADTDLDLMTPGQSLPELASRLLDRLPAAVATAKPSCVMVQGDTTTAFIGALTAFYQQVPVAHIEAGLRTRDPYAPFPEEINRRLVGQIARWHFAPTEKARQNLLREGVPTKQVYVTGNTVIDALLTTAQTVQGLPDELQPQPGQQMILVTGHRRENFGPGIRNLCAALKEIAGAFPNARIIYPVHPNPNVREPVSRLLSGISNIQLIDPVDYPTFVALMLECRFIITDSGGVQEEAPALGKPVLVTRDATERPEAVEAGFARLVGTNTDAIVRAARQLLTDERLYARMSTVENPFGDGRAAERIADVLENDLLAELH
ncbi:MAG: UDP-N-acetylglucosamine 2-epimerase (non-hydrolyzing) [Candidatus Sumerlaeaceae bacterium]|nr:UDP-N-acetylglucosamine 2-epimerase (non-hydrolyzing) [Candidatus Sumerlaeaceae bacterium]